MERRETADQPVDIQGYDALDRGALWTRSWPKRWVPRVRLFGSARLVGVSRMGRVEVKGPRLHAPYLAVTDTLFSTLLSYEMRVKDIHPTIHIIHPLPAW